MEVDQILLTNSSPKAVIDCGTNTFNLLIFEKDEHENVHILFRERQVVKLLSTSSKFIGETPFKCGINALKKFHQTILKFQCTVTSAIGTSALRTTENGNLFKEKAFKETGICIDIVSGKKEAELIVKGVASGISFSENPVLIMDIGGGSTEFIIAKSDQVLWSKSYPLGVSRIMRNFELQDPLSQENISTLFSHFKFITQELKLNILQHQPSCLIGSSGAFDSFAEMLQEKNNQTDKKIENGYTLPHEQVLDLLQVLLISNIEKRLSFPGLIQMRADTIHLSALLVKYVFDLSQITKFKLSQFSLKEGVIAEL